MNKNKLSVLLSAAALCAGALAMAGGQAGAAAAQPSGPTVSVQNVADGSNLDGYDGDEVWTRDPSYEYQEWTLRPVGNGTHLIESTHYENKCVTAKGRGQVVRLETCNGNNLSQRWISRLADLGTETTIESSRYRGSVLQGNGWDTAVTLAADNGNANQLWISYLK